METLVKSLKKYLAFLLLAFASPAMAADPVVLIFIIDGIQRDAVEVAAANGAANLKFLMENGTVVRDAYSTSPAPRMHLPDGSLPWGTSSSPNVAMHTGTHVYESRKMDDIFLAAREKGIKSVFAGGANNYSEFTTPDFTYSGPLTDEVVVDHGIRHFKNDNTRLIRLHLQRIRDAWTGPKDKLDPASKYQRDLLRVDALLGKFIGVLKEAGVWDSTYVIIAGDHGMGQETRSNHPPSVTSSWETYMNFYGPKVKKKAQIPYAEIPDIAPMVNHFLGLRPLKGHTDPNVTVRPNGVTATFLSNILLGYSGDIKHPRMIERYINSKNGKPSDEFAEYREAMLQLGLN